MVGWNLFHAINYSALYFEIFATDAADEAHRKACEEIGKPQIRRDVLLRYSYRPEAMQKNFQGVRWTTSKTMKEVENGVREYFESSDGAERAIAIRRLYALNEFRPAAEKIYLEQFVPRSPEGLRIAGAASTTGPSGGASQRSLIQRVGTPPMYRQNSASSIAHANHAQSEYQRDQQGTDLFSRISTPAAAGGGQYSPVNMLDSHDENDAGQRAVSEESHGRQDYEKTWSDEDGSVFSRSRSRADSAPPTEAAKLERPSIDQILQPDNRETRGAEVSTGRPREDSIGSPSNKRRRVSNGTGLSNVDAGDRSTSAVSVHTPFPLPTDTPDGCTTSFQEQRRLSTSNPNFKPRAAAVQASQRLENHYRDRAPSIEPDIAQHDLYEEQTEGEEAAHTDHEEEEEEEDELDLEDAEPESTEDPGESGEDEDESMTEDPPMKYQAPSPSSCKQLDLAQCQFCSGFYVRVSGGGLKHHELYWCSKNPNRREGGWRAHAARLQGKVPPSTSKSTVRSVAQKPRPFRRKSAPKTTNKEVSQPLPQREPQTLFLPDPDQIATTPERSVTREFTTGVSKVSSTAQSTAMEHLQLKARELNRSLQKTKPVLPVVTSTIAAPSAPSIPPPLASPSEMYFSNTEVSLPEPPEAVASAAQTSSGIVFVTDDDPCNLLSVASQTPTRSIARVSLEKSFNQDSPTPHDGMKDYIWDLLGMFLNAEEPTEEIVQVVNETLAEERAQSTSQAESQNDNEPRNIRFLLASASHTADEEKQRGRNTILVQYLQLFQDWDHARLHIDVATVRNVLDYAAVKSENFEVMKTYLNLFCRGGGKMKVWSFLSKLEAGVSLARLYDALMRDYAILESETKIQIEQNQ